MERVSGFLILLVKTSQLMMNLKKMIKSKITGSILISTILFLLAVLLFLQYYQFTFVKTVENNQLLVKYFESK